MCLGIPMQITAIDGSLAQCHAKGIGREVSLFMLQEPVAVGDFVIVHVGYAIQKIEPAEARTRWDLYDAMMEAGGKGAP